MVLFRWLNARQFGFLVETARRERSYYSAPPRGRGSSSEADPPRGPKHTLREPACGAPRFRVRRPDPRGRRGPQSAAPSMTHRAPTDIEAPAEVFSGEPTARPGRPIVRFISVNEEGRPAVQVDGPPLRTGLRALWLPRSTPCLRQLRVGTTVLAAICIGYLRLASVTRTREFYPATS